MQASKTQGAEITLLILQYKRLVGRQDVRIGPVLQKKANDIVMHVHCGYEERCLALHCWCIDCRPGFNENVCC